jgi:DNA-binding NarL/FixJ family response regulator
LKEGLDDHKIDIVLLDLNLAGLNSIRTITELKDSYPNLKIILFASENEKVLALPAYKIGVLGFVLKATRLIEIEKVFLKVNNGELAFDELELSKMERMLRTKKSDRLYKKLSNREVEVLRYLNDGKKNKEIAIILSLDEKTISTYKLRLLAKLGVSNLVDLLNKAKQLEII